MLCNHTHTADCDPAVYRMRCLAGSERTPSRCSGLQKEDMLDT